LTATFDGTAKAAQVTTIPPGIATSVLYNGGSALPIHAGTYTVLTTVTQSGYSGSASGTLTIGKGAATVTLGDLNFTFDGTAKAATATTNPGSLAVIFTYDGSTTVPTDAGTYSVTATINDPDFQGSASGTMTIAAATSATPVPALGPWGIMLAIAGLSGIMYRRRNTD
jgi:hypothetical protein